MIRKISAKYTAMSAPVKASLWFTICSVLQKGITLLSTPIFTRILTTEQYGVYSVYQSWYFILNIFVTLQLYLGVYNNGMTKYPEDREGFTSSMLGLSSTITIAMFGVYLIGRSIWDSIFELAPIYIYAMFLEFLFAPAFNFWSSSQRYDYKYKKLVVATLFMSISSPLLGVCAVFATEYKAEARVLSYVAIQIIMGIVFYIHIMRKGKRFFDLKYWKFGLAFNIPLIPHYLSTMILNQSDRIMINNMIGTGEAAIYSVAYQISMMMTIITTAINNSFVPYTYKELKDNRNENIKNNAQFLLVVVGIACLLVTAFGPEIIWIFASKSYYNAIWVIPPVAISVYFMFLYPLFANIEFYYEKTKFVAIASSLAAILNLILNYIFIPMYGYYAAGYTTLVSYIVYSCAHMFVYKNIVRTKLNDRSIYDLKFIFAFSIVMIIAMICMTITYKFTIVRYSVIGITMLLIIVNRNKIVQRWREIKRK